MIHRRTRDLGHFHHVNLELLIFIAILGILAVVAIPSLTAYFEGRNSRCIEHLIARTNGPLPEGTVCPKGDKPYAIVSRGEDDVLACPATERHLTTAPELVRSKGGAWRLRQTLPPYAGVAPELGSGRLEVNQSPGRVSLHVLPAGLNRFFAGPLFFAVLAALGLVAVGATGSALWKRDWGGAVLRAIGAVVLGGIGWFDLTSFASSTEFVFERSPSRVTRIDYFLGSRASQVVYAGCLGLIPAPGIVARPARLYLVCSSESEGRRAVLLETLPAKRLDVADWLNRTLLGP